MTKMPRAPAKLPHVTKLMVLAIRLEHLLATGQVKDQAEKNRRNNKFSQSIIQNEKLDDR